MSLVNFPSVLAHWIRENVCQSLHVTGGLLKRFSAALGRSELIRIFLEAIHFFQTEQLIIPKTIALIQKVRIESDSK